MQVSTATNIVFRFRNPPWRIYRWHSASHRCIKRFWRCVSRMRCRRICVHPVWWVITTARGIKHRRYRRKRHDVSDTFYFAGVRTGVNRQTDCHEGEKGLGKSAHLAKYSTMVWGWVSGELVWRVWEALWTEMVWRVQGELCPLCSCGENVICMGLDGVAV